MTLADIERVVEIVGKVQPQVSLAVQAIIGLAKWIGRRREQGEVEPTDDAVLAGWEMARARLELGSSSLGDAQSAIDARLEKLK